MKYDSYNNPIHQAPATPLLAPNVSKQLMLAFSVFSIMPSLHAMKEE
jgi:hypothetical protein